MRIWLHPQQFFMIVYDCYGCCMLLPPAVSLGHGFSSPGTLQRPCATEGRQVDHHLLRKVRGHHLPRLRLVSRCRSQPALSHPKSSTGDPQEVPLPSEGIGGDHGKVALTAEKKEVVTCGDVAAILGFLGHHTTGMCNVNPWNVGSVKGFRQLTAQAAGDKNEGRRGSLGSYKAETVLYAAWQKLEGTGAHTIKESI